MPLRNYAGPGLGRGSGWECPNCGAPNASARGSQCISCGYPPDTPAAEPPTLVTDRVPDGAEESPLDAPLGSNAQPNAALADGPRQELVRRYKLIEYYGAPDWVELAIKRSLFGAKAMGTHGYLIGTEVSEAAVTSQTELLQRVTEARATDASWEAAGWASGETPANEVPQERPAPQTVFQQTMRAMEEVMEKDPRYARTMAEALNEWVVQTQNKPPDETQFLTPDEVSQVVHILTLITTDKEPQPA